MDGSILKRAGTLIFVGVGQYAFCFILAEIYYPGYDVSTQTISDLGATCSGGLCRFFQPSSDIFNASIVLLGTMLLAAAYYIRKGSRTTSLPFFGFLSGVGCIGVGLFNESFGAAHTFFSAFTFFAIGIQAILAFKVVKPPFSYFTIAIGVITLAATLLYGTDTFLGLGRGGMERMVVVPALIEGIAFGGYLMALGDALRP